MSTITIRPLKEKDISAMAKIAEDAEIQKLTLFVRAKERGEDLETTFQNLIKAQDKGWYLSYTILEDDRCVGYAMSVSNEKTPDTYWLGAWTDVNERGRSIATKAMQLVIDQTRKLDMEEGISSIFKAAVVSTNTASLRMIENLGFEKVTNDSEAPDASQPMYHFILRSSPV